MKYIIRLRNNFERVFETNNLKDAKQYIIDNELRDYQVYLKHKQKCIEKDIYYNDYQSIYFIDYKNRIYDITNLAKLKEI